MVELLPDQQLHFENGLYFIRYMSKIRKKLVSILIGTVTYPSLGEKRDHEHHIRPPMEPGR